MAHLEDVQGHQGADGLAQVSPRHVQQVHQLGLCGQRITGLEALVDDQFLDGLDRVTESLRLISRHVCTFIVRNAQFLSGWIFRGFCALSHWWTRLRR